MRDAEVKIYKLRLIILKNFTKKYTNIMNFFKNFYLIFVLGKLFYNPFPLTLDDRNIGSGTLSLKYSHSNVYRNYPFSNSIDHLWNAISGDNKAELFHLLPFYYAHDNLMFLKWGNRELWNKYADKDIYYYYVPYAGTNEIILTISMQFTFYDRNKNVKVMNCNFNISEFLLFKSNVTDLRRKHFTKYIHKMFNKHNVALDGDMVTNIKVTYFFKSGKNRKN